MLDKMNFSDNNASIQRHLYCVFTDHLKQGISDAGQAIADEVSCDINTLTISCLI